MHQEHAEVDERADAGRRAVVAEHAQLLEGAYHLPEFRPKGSNVGRGHASDLQDLIDKGNFTERVVHDLRRERGGRFLGDGGISLIYGGSRGRAT